MLHILLTHLFLCLHLTQSLVIDGEPKNLPIYAEYMRRLSGRTTTSTPEKLQTPEQQQQQHGKRDIAEMQVQIPYAIPAIQLCKEKPADDSFYGHVSCWAMIILFASTILSLLFYLVRSIFWMRLTYSEKRQQLRLRKQKAEDIPLVTFPFDDGQHTNFKHFDGNSRDESNISRMLPLRQITGATDHRNKALSDDRKHGQSQGEGLALGRDIYGLQPYKE